MGNTVRRLASRSIALAAWAGTAVAVAWIAFAYLLPEDLDATGGLYVRLATVAFFGRVFTFHTGLALATATAAGLLLRRWRLSLVAGLAAAACLGPTLYACRPRTPPVPAGPTLRVLSANLLFENTDAAAVERVVRAADPDVVTFQEYTYAFDARLAPALAATYPYQCRRPQRWAAGLAVYSKLPFVGDPRPDQAGLRAQIRAVVSLAGRPVAVYAVHPAAPLNTWAIVRNRRQTADYARQVAAEPLPAVLAGDWNFTAETANAAALRAAGLTDAFDTAGRGRGSTWPARPRWLSWPPGVRIDHVYLTPDLTCTRYATVTDDDGSDHRPIVADVSFATR